MSTSVSVNSANTASAISAADTIFLTVTPGGAVVEAASAAGAEAEVRQTNHEGVLVDWIQQARGVFDAIVLNAAAYTHTSVAILDAIKAVRIPVAEVHLTEPKEREPFRRVSYVGMAAEAVFSGRGFDSYADAIRHFAAKGA